MICPGSAPIKLIVEGDAAWLPVDPQLADTQQPYAYGDGNPVDHTDPSGESIFTPYYTFTPWNRTYRADDSDGILEAAYNFYEGSGIFSWRYQVQPALCAGGEGATASAEIFNVGGRAVPNTSYFKPGVSPCYGFHSLTENNPRLSVKGYYQLRGVVRWIREEWFGFVTARYTVTFSFEFRISVL